MWRWLQRLLDGGPQAAPQIVRPRVVLTDACLAGIANGLRDTTSACHEGVVYLLGRTDGETTLVLTAIRPAARTTRGSFEVNSAAMARVVRSAADLALHIVGQVHTHPGGAAHSDGDVAGARIRYPGYVSIVLPDYGRRLPRLDGAAIYTFVETRDFVQLDEGGLVVVPGEVR
jgi:proteasome lid subunit RPN8/RPN11